MGCKKTSLQIKNEFRVLFMKKLKNTSLADPKINKVCGCLQKFEDIAIESPTFTYNQGWKSIMKTKRIIR